MEFTARIRMQNESTIITIPNEIVKVLGIKEGDFCQFSVQQVQTEFSELKK